MHFNNIFPSRLGLPKDLLPSGLPTKPLYAFLDSFMRATCPAHLKLLDLQFRINLDEEYDACISTLCNFVHSLYNFVSLSPKYLPTNFILDHP